MKSQKNAENTETAAMDNSENRNTGDITGRLFTAGRDSASSYTGRHEVVKESNTGRLQQTGTRRVPAAADQSAQKPSFTGRHEAAAAAPAAEPVKAAAAQPEKENPPKAEPAPKSGISVERDSPEKRGNPKTKYYLLAMLIVVILIIGASIVLRSLSAKSEYLEYYNTALEAYYEKDYEAALTNLRSAAEIDRTEECLVLMSECYEHSGNYEKAIETLRLMDITDEDVRARITELQSRLDKMSNEGKVSVCGNYYSTSTSELVLKGMGLTDASLGEITQLYALTSLNVSNNSLRDLRALSALGGLTTLDLSGNGISSLSGIETLTGLRVLYLDNNPVTDFTPVYSLSNLATLSIKGISISTDQLAALSAALPNCAIHSEEVSQVASELSIAGITFNSEVTELNLSGLGISDISVLSKCRYLTRLDLSNNDIYDISCLMDIPNLKWLDISSNSISDLRPIMSLSSLTYLNAENNYISSAVVIGRLPLLKTLDISGNPLTDISALGRLTKLSSLDLSSTGLEDEMLMYLLDCKALSFLNITENPALTGEAVQGFTNAVSTCEVEHDPLTFSVTIGDNLYRDDATMLDLGETGFADLASLSIFKQLEWLNLRGNGISNIYNLEPLSTLKYLDLSDNMIEDITVIAGMVNLEQLNLSNNTGLSTITQFLGLASLTELNLSGTSVSPENIEVLAANMPWCHIVY